MKTKKIKKWIALNYVGKPALSIGATGTRTLIIRNTKREAENAQWFILEAVPCIISYHLPTKNSKRK